MYYAYVYIYTCASFPHHMVRDKLVGPANLGTWGGGKRSWMSPYIKFGFNPMFLTPSSVAYKFNNFILKKEIDL